MKLTKFIIFATIALFILPYIYRKVVLKNQIQTDIEQSVTKLGKKAAHSMDQSGFIEEVGTGKVLTEERIHFLIKDLSQATQSHSRSWSFGNSPMATLSAQGLDHLHHFANSFLVGYEPFKTDKIWVPLYSLGMRKKYQYDHLQHSGLMDIWQNSLQAYYYTRGDCEDHAIILADWLISAGHDARVVLGKFKGGGHAWVVLFHEGKEYILEATNKKKIRKLKHYPLAKLATSYVPTYQFNRRNFWVNTGHTLTTRYTGPHWALRSQFNGK